MPRRVDGARPRNYGSFYWPLTLTSVAMQLESQFQNAVLARYPDADAELATFALASSSFQLLNAFLIFIPQTITVLAATPQARRACLRFIVGVSVALSLPMALMAYTPAGTGALAGLLNIPPEVRPAVVRYLRWLTPLLVVNGLRQYYTGLLIQAERTRAVTGLNFVHLGSLIAMLLLGRNLGWSALGTLAGATIASNVLHLLLIWRTGRPAPDAPRHGGPDAGLTFREFMAFFWPVAFTSGMFALSRPVTYAFVNRTATAVVTVAALRLAFDLSLFFQNPVNQFRHLYTTFGAVDPEGVHRYSMRVTTGLTAGMVLIAFTPLSRVILGNWMGVEGEVLTQATGALRMMCLGPFVLAFRNMHHGHMMVRRRTHGMAAGAILRVASVWVCSWALFRLGLLDHHTAAAVSLVGFAAETLSARVAVRRMRAE